ncbi:N-alpha-acetyltransferase 40 [Copidosoma floridanum]|uniref:N-alpha-acetyltransferase 40 n=1 Tax=Copidosoma floridanum TaxID=29053 RepID=UPI0006C9A5DA|nr:N-alpha-acetyltransferase 40 [Copidosoma floridanum]
MKNKTPRKTRKQLQAEKETASQNLVQKANAKDDPLEKLTKFHSLTLNDGSTVELSCSRVTELSGETIVWIFDLMERNMKTLYIESIWGWDEHKKQTELTEECAYYLIATHRGRMVGFSHFRFDMDHSVEVLYCYELQLEPSERRKGIGQFMMQALEAMATDNQMQKVVLTVLTKNPIACSFFHKLRYKIDVTSPPSSEDTTYCILSKQNLRTA